MFASVLGNAAELGGPISPRSEFATLSEITDVSVEGRPLGKYPVRYIEDILESAIPRHEAQHLIEHGYSVAHILQNDAKFRLMLREFVGAAAQFLEQPRTLHRDRRLVREGLEELYLCSREWLHLTPSASNDTDRSTLSEDRYSKERSVARHRLQYLARSHVVIALGQNVTEMRRPPVNKGSAHDKAPPGWPGKQAMECCCLLRRHVVDRFEMEQPFVESRHRAELRLTQFGRIPHDRVEHRPDVGRGARDDVQDLGGCCLLGHGAVTLRRALPQLFLKLSDGTPRIVISLTLSSPVSCLPHRGTIHAATPVHPNGLPVYGSSGEELASLTHRRPVRRPPFGGWEA